MFPALRPIIAALLTIPIRILVNWLILHGAEGLTEQNVSAAVEAFIVFGIPIASAVGVIMRRWIDKHPWANPGNKADPALAEADAQRAVVVKEQLKRGLYSRERERGGGL